jgi:UDP-glucose 4-epimerase
MKKYLEKFNRANVMITGGLGFIGSNLAHRLIELGSNILIVDSLDPFCGGNYYNIGEIEDRITVKIMDISDESSMRDLVKERQYIFNLAGQVSHIDSMNDPYKDLHDNCRGQLSLLEACRKENPGVKIVFASTRQIYGVPQQLPVDEKHPFNCVDINGVNKLTAEWYHTLYNRVYGLRTVSLRLTNTYGPRQLMRHSRQGFIAWFLRQAIEDKQIQIFGSGKQVRDLNYVDDVCEAFLLAAVSDQADGSVFNLGSGEPISLFELTKLLLDITKLGSYKLVPFPNDRKKIDIGDYHADYSKIKKTLGWKPLTLIREGLEKTVEFYRKNQRHYW